MFGSVLPGDSQAVLALLGQSGAVKDAYLAGGSALALHFGHRYSVDFDFFTQLEFDPNQKANELGKIGEFVKEFAKGISLSGTFNSVKFSYFQYSYPMIAEVSRFVDVSIADPKDIAAMKLVAISDRSTKKDYVDLYTLCHKGYSFDQMFELYNQKYGVFESNKFTLLKSLTYLDEAEKTDMPQMLIPLTWEEVKNYLIEQSDLLAKKYLEE